METTEKHKEGYILAPSGYLFFFRMHDVYSIINMPSLPNKGYECMKTHGWPTWKTFNGLMSNLKKFDSCKKTTLEKMNKMASDLGIEDEVKKETENTRIFWRPYLGWKGILIARPNKETGGIFFSKEGREYWLDQIETEKKLVEEISNKNNPFDKFELILDCEIAKKSGAKHARSKFARYLKENPNSDNDDIEKEYIAFISAASFATLIRFSAWLVADWESMTSHIHQRIPIEEFWPKYNRKNGKWNNPVSDFINYLADFAGRPKNKSAITFLGGIWAEHETKEQNKTIDKDSKDRLVRNWASLKGGRPEPSSIYSLSMAAAHHQNQLSVDQCKALTEAFSHAFILLETCGSIQRSLKNLNLENLIIEDIFSSYFYEYNIAKRAMGMQ